MKKFIILFKLPIASLDAWMAKSPEERKPFEEKNMADWNVWSAANKANIIEMGGAGKTKLVTTSGVTDSRNDIMLYGIVQAEDQEKAAQMFVGHPHLDIPESTIEVIAANSIPLQ